MDTIVVGLKPHEIRTVIGARLGVIAPFYAPHQVWTKQDLIGELQRLIVLAHHMPDK